MKMRTLKTGLLWEDKRFTIKWSPEDASWVMYDRQTKQHHKGIASLGNAFDLADEFYGRRVKIGLVACCKTKLGYRTVAERLYSSDLFQKAAAFCRRHYHRWFVLSAKYGLVCPSQVIDPYEQTLVGASAEAKRQWAALVVRQLQARGLLNDLHEFFFHAGQDYAEFLLPLMQSKSVLNTPMQGMGIGEQLKFYKEALSASDDHSNGASVRRSGSGSRRGSQVAVTASR